MLLHHFPRKWTLWGRPGIWVYILHVQAFEPKPRLNPLLELEWAQIIWSFLKIALKPSIIGKSRNSLFVALITQDPWKLPWIADFIKKTFKDEESCHKLKPSWFLSIIPSNLLLAYYFFPLNSSCLRMDQRFLNWQKPNRMMPLSKRNALKKFSFKIVLV